MKTYWNELQNELAKYIPIIAQWKITKKDYDNLIEIVSETQKKSFDYWKQTTSSEMWVKVKPTNDKVYEAMLDQNKVIIWKMIYDINLKLQRFSEEWIVSQFIHWLNTLYVSWAINLGRETVYENNKELVYAFQYSAILDWKTTNICRTLDWLIVEWWSKEQRKYQPPNHWNCRSIRVEILEDEIYKPKISVSVPNIKLPWKTDFSWYLKNLATKTISEWLTKDEIQDELKKLEKEMQKDNK
jgi:hypothetical protein